MISGAIKGLCALYITSPAFEHPYIVSLYVQQVKICSYILYYHLETILTVIFKLINYIRKLELFTRFRITKS